MDSGVAESVAPPTVSERPAVWDPNTASQRYWTASGETVGNQGVKVVRSRTQGGRLVEMRCQIANVAKPLNSVSKICDKGDEVVFQASGGYVRNIENCAKIPFKGREGVYVLSTWSEEPTSVFNRWGA